MADLIGGVITNFNALEPLTQLAWVGVTVFTTVALKFSNQWQLEGQRYRDTPGVLSGPTYGPKPSIIMCPDLPAATLPSSEHGADVSSPPVLSPSPVVRSSGAVPSLAFFMYRAAGDIGLAENVFQVPQNPCEGYHVPPVPTPRVQGAYALETRADTSYISHLGDLALEISQAPVTPPRLPKAYALEVYQDRCYPDYLGDTALKYAHKSKDTWSFSVVRVRTLWSWVLWVSHGLAKLAVSNALQLFLLPLGYLWMRHQMVSQMKEMTHTLRREIEALKKPTMSQPRDITSLMIKTTGVVKDILDSVKSSVSEHLTAHQIPDAASLASSINAKLDGQALTQTIMRIMIVAYVESGNESWFLQIFPLLDSIIKDAITDATARHTPKGDIVTMKSKICIIAKETLQKALSDLRMKSGKGSTTTAGVGMSQLRAYFDTALTQHIAGIRDLLPRDAEDNMKMLLQNRATALPVVLNNHHTLDQDANHAFGALTHKHLDNFELIVAAALQEHAMAIRRLQGRLQAPPQGPFPQAPPQGPFPQAHFPQGMPPRGFAPPMGRGY